MKLTLDKFLEYVRLNEEIGIFDMESENIFVGTVKEFFDGEGWYPHVPGVSYSYETICDRTIYRVGPSYHGDGLEIIIR